MPCRPAPRAASADELPSKQIGETVAAPYNAANSAGPNLGPMNKALIERVKTDMERLKAASPTATIAIDLVGVG